jgi:hypothetical protein
MPKLLVSPGLSIPNKWKSRDLEILFSTIKKSSTLVFLDGVDTPVDFVVMEGCLNFGRIPEGNEASFETMVRYMPGVFKMDLKKSCTKCYFICLPT